MPARLTLSAFLPYRLSIVMQAVSDGLARRYSDEFGITIPEWRIIATLGENEAMTARDIAAATRMNKTMVSRAAASLLQRGLLLRRENRRDRREAFLALGKRGRDIYEAVVPLARAYERDLMRDMPPADRAALDRALDLLLLRADKALAGTGARAEGEDT